MLRLHGYFLRRLESRASKQSVSVSVSESAQSGAPAQPRSSQSKSPSPALNRCLAVDLHHSEGLEDTCLLSTLVKHAPAQGGDDGGKFLMGPRRQPRLAESAQSPQCHGTVAGEVQQVGERDAAAPPGARGQLAINNTKVPMPSWNGSKMAHPRKASSGTFKARENRC